MHFSNCISILAALAALVSAYETSISKSDDFFCRPVSSLTESDVEIPEGCNCTAMQEEITKLKNTQLGSGIENIAFTFGRRNQVSDYVRYLPKFPSLREVTMCAWINITDITSTQTIFSYSASSSYVYDMFTLRLSNSRTIQLEVYDYISYLTIDLQANKQNHFCVWFSQSLSRVGVHINGDFRDDAAYSGGSKSIAGGGYFIIGQEQDSYGGSFSSSYAFSGTVTNLKMWPRKLKDEEIRKIAKKCKYPVDVIVQPTLDKIEWFGNATVTYPSNCPKL